MNKKWIIMLSVLAAGAITVVGLIFYVIGIYNTNASLRNNYEMKIKSNQAQFDNMFKTIQQTAQIPEAKKEAFKEIYAAYVGGRAGGEGKLATFVTEAVPNPDLNEYRQLMNIISGSRATWTTNQNELVGIAEEYNKNLSTQPRGFILSMLGFDKIDPQVITSDRTEEVFTSGKDNDVNLFPAAK